MGVSENSVTPKSSILLGFSIINHPFWGTPIFGNTHMKKKSPHPGGNPVFRRVEIGCDERSVTVGLWNPGGEIHLPKIH